MPFSANYDIGMNGKNPGASQWFKLNVNVGDNGSILIHNRLDNDTLQGWSGSYRFEFHDLRDNALLFYIVSPVYSIGPKPPGQHIVVAAADIYLTVDAGLAQRFIAHPSMYGVRDRYDQDALPFGITVQQLGQAVLTVAEAV